MGRVVVSEKNIAFLMSEVKRLELDKRIKEESAKIGIRNMLAKGMEADVIAELLEVEMSLVEEVEKEIK